MLTLSNQRWMDPITETPRVGSVEVWEIMILPMTCIPSTCTSFNFNY
jgi:hypothetical protein